MADMKSGAKTVMGICSFIFELEKKYDLYNYEVDGVKVWQASRIAIYYTLAKEVGVLTQPHENASIVKKILSIVSGLYNTIANSPFTLSEAEVLVLSHPRVVRCEGSYCDIYTRDIIGELRENHSVTELELPYLGSHKKEKKSYTRYLDWVDFLYKIKNNVDKFRRVFPKDEKILLIEREIERHFGVGVDIWRILNDSSREFLFKYKCFDYVFKKVKPEVFFVVIAYMYPFAVKAAKDNDVEVVELQHGTISKYHLGYSYPKNADLIYFPDKLYVWNLFWKELNIYPLPDEKVIVDRFRYLENEKALCERKGLRKDEKKVVVISQGAIGEKIAEKILKEFYRFDGCEVYYKLHPGEYSRYESYECLMKLITDHGVKVVKDEIPLYELFLMCSLQIGVFSTAIYEGIEFGCETILLDLPGIEYMTDLSEQGSVRII